MTAVEEIEDVKKCPFCGSNIDLNKLGRLGLSAEELEIIAQHTREGTLKEMLQIAQIAWRVIDPEKATSEFQVKDATSKLRETSNQCMRKLTLDAREFVEKVCTEREGDKVQVVKEYMQKIDVMQKEIVNATRNTEKLERENQIKYSELNESIKEIREKIVGTGIGTISEIVTIRDLKEVVTTDSFSEARASKGGSDIVAIVKEKGVVYGTVTVSNKCTQKWEGSFLSQLTRDMKNDGSRFGILVTKAFPREALSSKAHLVDSEDGKTIILVKPEYAPLAYFGLREATIHWYETRKILKRKEDEAEESEKTFKALTTWINGEDFEESIRHIDTARNAATETRRELASMRSRLNLQIDRATKFQDSIEQNLLYAKTLIEKLRDLLNSGSSESFS